MGADRLLHGLDAEQRLAVTTPAAPLAVIAAAGSGKTTVLTRRIAHRIATDQAEAAHVLALTFTRDAASELVRRLRRFDLGAPVDAGTFHSVALRLLRDRALANHRPMPSVANDRPALVAEALRQGSIRADAYGAGADLDWARARLVTPDRYEQAVRQQRRRSAVPPARYAEFAEAYAAIKQRRGVVDFDDLLDGVLQAMRTDPAWAEGVRWRYRHFFVDEAQDLNPLQHAVLEALRNGRPDLCLVGDPRQAIYGWNGADHTTLTEVEHRYPGVTVIELTSNYRCSPQVVRAAAAALTAAGQTDATASQQADGRAVTIAALDDEHAEAAAVARHVADLLHLHAPRELAVLARTNEQVSLLQSACTALGIPTERSAGRSPLHRVLTHAFRSPNRDRLAEWVDASLAGGDELTQRVAIEADRFLSSGEPGTFRTWVDARDPFADLDDGDGDSVALLTFHAAKGREWWGVVVTGAEEGLIPHGSASTPAATAEEARLFYVALTRASHHLLVTRAERRNGREVQPSRWLEAVEGAAAVDAPAPPPERIRRAPVDVMAPWREWRAGVARAAGIDPVAVCSDRVLRSLHDEPPRDLDDLARRLGVTPTAAARLHLPGAADDAQSRSTTTGA